MTISEFTRKIKCMDVQNDETSAKSAALTPIRK